MHRKVLTRRVHVVAGCTQQLGELGIDQLGGIEDRGQPHEIAGQHAVEQKVDLLRFQLDSGFGQRFADIRLRGCNGGAVFFDPLFGILDIAAEAVHGVGENAWKQ